MTLSKYVTLALIEGELSTLTVESADDGEDLVLHVPNEAMAVRAMKALRRAYPTNLIRSSGQVGNFVDVVQTEHQLDALRAPTRHPADQERGRGHGQPSSRSANEMTWADNCKSGSSYVTIVELEFHHVMIDREAPDDLQRQAPFPCDAVNIPNDCRSGFLVWLRDGSPAHARWCDEIKEFKRVGSDEAIDRATVRAWAALPFPVAAA